MKSIASLLLFSSFSFAGTITTNPTILYIGDSHSYGKLGTTIEKNLSTISNHVIMESSCGSSAYTWLGKTGYEKTVCGFWKKDGADETRSVEHQTPKYADEVLKYRPKVNIIQLGTNMAAATKPLNSKDSIDQLMKAAKANNATCIWIGPPDANSKIVTKEKLKIVNDLLKELTAQNGCHYIDSLELTVFPKDNKEGIHYPPKASSEWGEKVSQKILSILEVTEAPEISHP
jgi:hypothetical protein